MVAWMAVWAVSFAGLPNRSLPTGAHHPVALDRHLGACHDTVYVLQRGLLSGTWLVGIQGDEMVRIVNLNEEWNPRLVCTPSEAVVLTGGLQVHHLDGLQYLGKEVYPRAFSFPEMHLSPSGRWLVITGNAVDDPGDALFLMDLTTQEIEQIDLQMARVEATWQPGTDTLITAILSPDPAPHVRRWRPGDGDEPVAEVVGVPSLRDPKSVTHHAHLAASGDGRWLAFPAYSNERERNHVLALVDLRLGGVTEIDDVVGALTISPGGRHLAGWIDQSLVVVHLPTGRVRRLPLPMTRIEAVAASNSGKRSVWIDDSTLLIADDIIGLTWLWSGGPVRPLDIHSTLRASLRTPDGAVWTTGEGGLIRVAADGSTDTVDPGFRVHRIGEVVGSVVGTDLKGRNLVYVDAQTRRIERTLELPRR